MTYLGMHAGMNDLECPESSQDWSIYNTTTVLEDLAIQNQLLGHSEPDHLSFCDMQPKIVKSEPAEVFPPDAQHFDEWKNKPINYWTSHDCLYWLIYELRDLKLEQDLPKVEMERFTQIDGSELKRMTIDDFSTMFPTYGVELFYRLQKYNNPFIYNSCFSFDQWTKPSLLRADESTFNYTSSALESHTLTDLDNKSHLPPFHNNSSVPSYNSEADSGYKSDSSIETTVEQPPPPEKRRPGRPRGTKRKKKPEKLGRLWEFIRDLLLNPMYNPSLICWENYDEGTFRFVHSDRVAKLWGSKKDNVDMNYEKLSRAMRYYYKSKVLQPVYGKRLVYKFGPTATGWRSASPIFRQG